MADIQIRSQIKLAWNDFIRLLFGRTRRLQVAALCYREDPKGKKVLLITSRGTGRWIIPKGWPIKGLNSPQAAVQEAWEEAGVKARTPEDRPLGSYSYDKVIEDGDDIPVEAVVYPVAVDDLASDFPERDQRRRKWVRPEDAANMVDEPELKSILRDL